MVNGEPVYITYVPVFVLNVYTNTYTYTCTCTYTYTCTYTLSVIQQRMIDYLCTNLVTFCVNPIQGPSIAFLDLQPLSLIVIAPMFILLV